uniref:AlNc14C44G3644 protein n=1 Tax=Albugo laibachii Nc14 TaxID=890382 RepID=F0WAB5_9STRA|nr:AlNc14C44G3644 [Albugo laibachii Nc14]|eukprot:CCA18085.1 AlNc14C44G3644 [Albugo laibachii Nc14]
MNYNPKWEYLIFVFALVDIRPQVVITALRVIVLGLLPKLLDQESILSYCTLLPLLLIHRPNFIPLQKRYCDPWKRKTLSKRLMSCSK